MAGLKPYILFNRHLSPADGAILVIAHSLREARQIGFQYALMADQYTDLGARWVRDRRYLLLGDADKIKNGEAHVVPSPLCCVQCGVFGAGLCQKENGEFVCDSCNRHPGDDLIDLIGHAYGAKECEK